jgi:hypothetical protein
MQLAQHNPSAGKRLGISPSVAKEFTGSYNSNMPQHVPTTKATPAQRVAALKAIKP